MVLACVSAFDPSACRNAVWLAATTSTSGSPADSRSSASQARAAGPVTDSAVPPEPERTLRRTVTSSCFVVGRPSLFRSVRGLLRFGAVTVGTVALLRNAVTMTLVDLGCAAARRSERCRSVVTAHRSDRDRILPALSQSEARNAQNLSEATTSVQ